MVARIRFLQQPCIFNANCSESIWRSGGFNRSHLPLKILYHSGVVYTIQYRRSQATMSRVTPGTRSVGAAT